MTNQYEPDIQAFERADRQAAPPAGCAVFTGSSTIALWQTLAADFPFIHAVNRGFGGSVYSEVAMFARRIVTPLAPSLVVAYAGDNDLAGGMTPADVLADVRQFVTNVRIDCPRVPILLLSVKPSPCRWNLAPAMRETNALIEQYTRQTPGLSYFDTFSPMLGPDGLTRRELYVEDQLHMSPAGYALWRELLTPTIKAM
jgi:lysophospholipase L1-like esterase